MTASFRQRQRGYALVARAGAHSAQAAGDRLSATLFLAALFHGVIILGITFEAEPARREPTPNSLDVVIVTRDYEKIAAPRNAAALLAQQNLIGRGNAPLGSRVRTAVPGHTDPAAPGPDRSGALQKPGRTGTPQPAERWLNAAARDRPTIRHGASGTEPVPVAQHAIFSTAADSIEILSLPDVVNRIPDANPRELLVSASTREARIAGYLNSWKNRVERIGTLNPPGADQLATAHTAPVLEVAITAEGQLKDVVVRNSSGYRNLDQAAIEILRMAAPFDPFPQRLRADYDVLRFAYEWHFGPTGSLGRVTAVNGS